MLYFSKWKIASIFAVIFVGVVFTLPNFISSDTLSKSWPNWLPGKQLVLGLDLQGGVYLLYEIDENDFKIKRLKTLKSEARKLLREKPRVSYRSLKVIDEGLQIRLKNIEDSEAAIKRVTGLLNPLSGSILGGQAVNEFELKQEKAGVIRLEFAKDGFDSRIRSIVAQSIEVVRKRVDEFGTTEPSIQREGNDRILVEAPGVRDPERLKNVIGKTAQMTFQLVDISMPAREAYEGTPPIGSVVAESYDNSGRLYLVEEAALLTGQELVDAQVQFSQNSNQPVVTFQLSPSGGVKFAQVTAQNVGRPFAIMLDGKVVSAPTINSPIPGGSGQIEGGFTVDSANDLAILLRAGALPANLRILEERTVGPGLGVDSIEAGRIASIVALILVICFMIVAYGLFGIIADIALLANVLLVFGALSGLGATLTLPGIAGIVLTVGMAVDANVLIFERIREEISLGRPPISAIDAGYSRALTTILDANITTFITAIILFVLGSGPIKGFAVTLAIGIISTVFTAFVFSRLMIALWIRWQRPTQLPI